MTPWPPGNMLCSLTLTRWQTCFFCHATGYTPHMQFTVCAHTHTHTHTQKRQMWPKGRFSPGCNQAVWGDCWGSVTQEHRDHIHNVNDIHTVKVNFHNIRWWLCTQVLFGVFACSHSWCDDYSSLGVDFYKAFKELPPAKVCVIMTSKFCSKSHVVRACLFSDVFPLSLQMWLFYCSQMFVIFLGSHTHTHPHTQKTRCKCFVKRLDKCVS